METEDTGGDGGGGDGDEDSAGCGGLVELMVTKTEARHLEVEVGERDEFVDVYCRIETLEVDESESVRASFNPSSNVDEDDPKRIRVRANGNVELC